jgi:glycosyltransferase involved in cell wall biosynthesis
MARDEQNNIGDAIRSAAPFVKRAILCDTGSKDDTVGVFEAVCLENGLRHVTRRHSWDDFGANRSRALGAARAWTEGNGFTLMLDADDRVENIDNLPNDGKPYRYYDAYKCAILLGNLSFERACIFSNTKPWRYEGVTHEYPECEGQYTVRDGIVGSIRANTSGYRSRDPLKYLKDADTINEALKGEPDGPLRWRYLFYLAQSYRDAGHSGAAIYWYKIVLDNPGSWTEERYVAGLMLGRLTGESMYHGRAASINPFRAEARRALGNTLMADACKPSPGWLFCELDKYKV